MSSIGLISAILASDKCDKALSAAADRQDLDKELSVRLGSNESIDTFQHRFERALFEYNNYSFIRKFSDDRSGDSECIEHLLRMLGGGELHRLVSEKFEKKKFKAKAASSEPPSITTFWEVLRGIHLFLEHQRLRNVHSEPSRDGGTKRKQDDESINVVHIDGAAPKGPCRYEARLAGSCVHGAACSFSHDSAPRLSKSVRFDSTAVSDASKKSSPSGSKFGKSGKGKGLSNPKGGGKGGGKRSGALLAM
jgi:hypothetical protein